MSPLRLILASLTHHWRMNLAVACGVAAGTAVLTGALLVGDSMRGSLRRLTLDRLGQVDWALATDRFFREKLADELAAEPEFQQHTSAAVPAILLRANLEKADSRPPIRANRVNLIGCDERFWRLGRGHGEPNASASGQSGWLPGRREIVLNRPLAERLDVAIGDDIMLRLPRPGAVPAESPLGEKRQTVRSQRLKVCGIVEAEGLGRFGLRPTQLVPHNAYVSLASLQDALGEPDRVNSLLIAGGKLPPGSQSSAGGKLPPESGEPRETPPAPPWPWHPRLADYGIHLQETPRGYFNITSERMLLEPAAEQAIIEALKTPASPEEEKGDSPHLPRPTCGRYPPGGGHHARMVVAQMGTVPFFRPEDIQPTLTYLANTIARGQRAIPYSTVTAIDFTAGPPLGPFLSLDGKPIARLADDEVVLNSWAAEDLQAKPGDTVRVSYFEPESTHGQLREKTISLRLAAVAQLTGAADDPALTPSVRGITDQLSMADWDPPFPFDAKRVRPADDVYWHEHRATPKAFVSLATGRRLWASRFGQTTSLRIQPTPAMTTEGLQRKLTIDPATMGFVFQPVKQQGLAASAGTTPFNVLFLAFSSFIIVAAVMLVALLFRLSIDRRASEAGLLLAVGWRQRQVGRLFAAEGLLVAALGSLLGVAAGIGYAALMLAGLRTWWLAAVGTPLLRFCVTRDTPWSLAIGYFSGLGVAFAAIAWSARRIGRVPPRRLLAGAEKGDSPHLPERAGGCFAQMGTVPFFRPRAARGVRGRHWLCQCLSAKKHWQSQSHRRFPLAAVLLLLAAAPAVALLLIPLDEDVQAGAFFGAGAVALAALLTLITTTLRSGRTGPAVAAGRGNLFRMALRNAARNPGRSTLTIGLVASACFLIAAVSAFRIDPARQSPSLHGGSGGFALVAESDQPIYQDINTTEGRAQLGFSPEDERLLAQCTVIALRVKPGDDASCLNLYQPRQPRLLGVPPSLIQRDGFAWADVPRGDANPWLLLEKPAETPIITNDKTSVPVIIDKNTANYSLHLWHGPGEAYQLTDSRGRTMPLVVAALLGNSIFQGDLLLSEDALVRYDPEVSGYRFFLIQTPPDGSGAVQQALERTLGDYGLAVETTADRMAGFLAVQNTYLSTFQSLGGLGLLLGTIGLAAVQLRNVLERRGELALLRAAGFRRALLVRLVLLENALLLLAGLGAGIAAALVAILPHLLGRGAAIPWAALAVILTLVLALGMLAGLAAVRAVLRTPLLAALREEH